MSGHKLGYELTQHNQYKMLSDTGTDGGTIPFGVGGEWIKVNSSGNGESRVLPDPTGLPLGYTLYVVEASGYTDLELQDPNDAGAVATLENGEVAMLVVSWDADDSENQWRGVVLKENVS